MTLHADTSYAVRGEINKYEMLRERLLAQVPDIDAETLADTLEGVTDLREMVAALLRSALDDEALAAGLATRLADMKERLDRHEARARRKRQLALATMADADIGKLTEPDFTASLRQGPAGVDVVTEGEIPKAYWKPQPAKLDRQRLLADLKAGAEIAGAVLVPGSLQISVRTK